MLLTVLAILMSSACASAALLRLSYVVGATVLDPRVLSQALAAYSPDDRARFWSGAREEIRKEEGAEWERELADAVAAPPGVRVALVNEQVSELEFRAGRWARVPRVCASISTTFGFLLAFGKVASLASSLADMDFGDAVSVAINVVAVGVAGGAFCVAVHVRSRATARSRLAGMDALVSSLEGLPAGSDVAPA